MTYDQLIEHFTKINPTGDPAWPAMIADVDILFVECMADAGFWTTPD